MAPFPPRYSRQQPLSIRVPDQSTGYDYTRVNNPTRDELEKTVSSLEHAYDTMACTNGMAAIGLCLEFFFRAIILSARRTFTVVLCACLTMQKNKEA